MLPLNVEELIYRCTGVRVHMFITELLVITKLGIHPMCQYLGSKLGKSHRHVKKDH